MTTKNKAKSVTRTISTELFEQWKRLFRHSDLKHLMEITGKSKPTVQNALNYGYVSSNETAKQITKYFVDREKSESEQTETLKAL